MTIRLLTMDALRRLQQLSLVFNPSPVVGHAIMRRLSSMSDPGVNDNSALLKTVFSDINSSLLTSEARCNKFMEHYNGLKKEERGQFLCEMAKEYGADKDSIASMAYNITQSQDKNDASFMTSCERMRSVLKPRYKLIFSHLGRVTGGVKFLVDLRADILSLKQGTSQEMDAAMYQELNLTLRELFVMWFAVGFFNLERITWNSPCDLVQKVSNYEAVHRIKTWEDIKRRVGPYRRCYIFTHNAMPREPVVVLHTALTNEISSSIHSIIFNTRFRPSFHQEENYGDFGLENIAGSIPVSPTGSTSTQSSSNMSSPHPSQPTFSTSFTSLEKEDPSQINCAVFYSITSTQRGLQGVELGNYLIKSVVRKLQEEFPQMTQFSSLSPIPGFRDWLLSAINNSINRRNAGEDPGIPILLPDELVAIEPYRSQGQTTPLDTFKALITNHQWVKDEPLTHVMSGPLLRLAAQYLYVQKRRNYALNPVANFHLSNGAVLWRINMLADTSMRGLNQSCGLMVNYRYFLEMTDMNSRNYLENHQISASDAVLSLLSSASKDEGL